MAIYIHEFDGSVINTKCLEIGEKVGDHIDFLYLATQGERNRRYTVRRVDSNKVDLKITVVEGKRVNHLTGEVDEIGPSASYKLNGEGDNRNLSADLERYAIRGERALTVFKAHSVRDKVTPKLIIDIDAI